MTPREYNRLNHTFDGKIELRRLIALRRDANRTYPDPEVEE